MSPDGLLYLDNQNLLLKNQMIQGQYCLTQMQSDGRISDLGKWQMIAETSMGRLQSKDVTVLKEWLNMIQTKPINFAYSQDMATHSPTTNKTTFELYQSFQ
jgi:hypothetical protein